MPIRLLSKQEIHQRQAQEKHLVVSEGVKLAKRIDTLREIAANEESSLASFRNKTIKEINEQTQKAIMERDAVLSEVNSLREELALGTQILDKRANELNDYSNHLTALKIDLDKKISELETKEANLENAIRAIKEEEVRLAGRIEQINHLKEDTLAKHLEAETSLAYARTVETTALSIKEKVENELYTRETEVASRERDVMIKEERIENTAKALRERELQLIDREQTLERELLRLKNKKNEPNRKNK
jgi:hypothetical protein